MGCAVGYLYRTILKYYVSHVKQSTKLYTSPKLIVKNNIGTSDRLLRAIIATGLFLWAACTSWSPLLLIVSGFTWYEAAFRWCGWNALIGKNTCPMHS